MGQPRRGHSSDLLIDRRAASRMAGGFALPPLRGPPHPSRQARLVEVKLPIIIPIDRLTALKAGSANPIVAM